MNRQGIISGGISFVAVFPSSHFSQGVPLGVRDRAPIVAAQAAAE